MSKLSKPMLDALEEIGKGYDTTARPTTLKALETREYIVLGDDTTPHALTESGKANFGMYFGLDNLKTDPAGSDDHIAEYFEEEQNEEDDATYLDRNYVPGDMTTAEHVDLTTGADNTTASSTPETPVEAVEGLTAYLDTPHVVPNRKERRGWRKIRAVFNRTRAKVQDRRVSENARKESARKVRRGTRKMGV